ncbi:MAG: NUDIX hydrolase [Candidatus Omnitrophica bacterium]|nr:NUDIX hydrolase [Candidatus Omnitrophota bacterium]
MIQPWPQIESKIIGRFRIFSLRSDLKKSPRTGEPHEFFVIDTVNWVNVVALTARQEVVMIEQYRHGTNTIELEIPGGLMDAGDASPEATGVRELREETGYDGEGVQIIGRVFPNPAIMSNTCYTVLLRNCEKRHPVDFDQTEDLITRLVPLSEINQRVTQGEIRHSLVVAALYQFQLWQGEHPIK